MVASSADGEDTQFQAFVEPAGTQCSTQHAVPCRSVAQETACVLQVQRRNVPYIPVELTSHCFFAALILSNLIETHLPSTQPEYSSLLRRARALKLPKNPLVRHSCAAS